MMLRNVKQNVQKKFFLKIRDHNFLKLQRLNMFAKFGIISQNLYIKISKVYQVAEIQGLENRA